MFSFSNKSNFIFSNSTSNLFLLSLSFLLETIIYTLAGTFIGFLLAITTSFLSNKSFNNRYFSFIFKQILIILRSIPELTFILLFTQLFDSRLAMLLIFVWFTWLWLHKYYLEILNNINWKNYYFKLALTNNKLKIFKNDILPRVSNRFFALFLYSFESNARWSSILSMLGLGGIGSLISFATKTTFRFNQLAIPLVILIIFIIFLELINYLFNLFLYEIKSKKNKFEQTLLKIKNTDFINWKLIIKNLILLFCLIITIYAIATINFRVLNTQSLNDYLKAFFNPDWNVFNIKLFDINTNPFLQLIQSFSFAFFISFIALGITLLFLPYYSKIITNPFLTFINRSINASFRTIPTIVFFFILNPLFLSSLTLLIIILIIKLSSTFLKKCWEMIDKFDPKKYLLLKSKGMSKFKIYWLYLIPFIKYELISLFLLYFEISFRNSITYSILTGNDLALGYNINYYFNSKDFDLNKAFAFVWIATFAILSINYLNNFLIWKLKTRKNINFSNKKNIFVFIS
ncbi:ABC transporter permease [Mycoplasma sp. 1018B]|uniref:PhnE/PtxC family ABC transporter permease n=1 Tax=Mycoplasma sp. 1018B TaxID=2967302 RepID=UPI00211C871C|nr:ABC transporter permease subunit [Mycoplasma sp. 1018B]UUM18973.1 ABC transporter permease subunit [Mycoplasma sp. 1018B]